MLEERTIQFTDDPLTNIYMMIPMLNDDARKAISYLMYGCYLGETLAGDRKSPDSNAIKIIQPVG